MPNWNWNRLTVRNQTPEFIEFAKDGITLEKIIPTPKELLESKAPIDDDAKAAEFQAKYNASDWHDWRVKNWGCKWEVESPIEASEEGVFFDTPWSPPIEAFTRLSKDFPDVEFELAYCELGNWFAGVAVMKDGVLIDSVAKEDEDIKQIARDIFDYVLEEDIEELV